MNTAIRRLLSGSAAAAMVMLVPPVASAEPVEAMDGCITREGNTSWGSGYIHACAYSRGGSFARGWVHDKDADGHCVRWRIEWRGAGRQYTPWACPKGTTTRFDIDGPRASGVMAYLERVRV